MTDIFTPESKTIQNIFEGSNYYEIPSYQRPYSWESEQVDALWDDIYSAFENNEDEYFLGSIILTRKNNNKYLDVVDGQQRLTTLMILFCTLRDIHFSKLSDQTKKNLIEGRIKNLENGNERLKLRTQAQNQNQFEQEVIRGINFDLKLTQAQLKENKFINTAFRFKEKIDPLNGSDKIEKFTEYLLEKVRVVSITCSNRSFAIKLFQVLNNRGLDLTAADLIKSYLMMSIKDEDNLKTFEQDWIYIETKAKELEEELTNLFTYYEYYLLANNPKKALYDELETQFKNKDSLKVIHEFKNAINLFASMDSKSPKTIYSLYYLKHDTYWKSIILTSLIKGWNNEQITALAKNLRKLYFIYWVAGYTSSKIKQISFNIIDWIKEEKDINFIKKKITEKILSDRVVSRFRESLDGDVYKEAWCKPLLITLEYEQLEAPKMNFIEIDNDIHVEHIFPQAYSSDSYWSRVMTSDLADKLVNSLGNVTLLSGKKNIKASNHPFHEKLKVYEGTGKDGITPFILTQKITTNKIWNHQTIKARKDYLLSEIEKIFEIDFEKDIEEERVAIDVDNETKSERSKKINPPTDEKEKLRFEFWEGLLKKSKLLTDLHSNISPSKYHWIGAGAGKSGLSYNYVILYSYMGCELYIDRGKKFVEPNINKIRFDNLLKHKDEIEKIFGDKLSWERLDNKRACRIAFIFDYGLNDKNKWPEIQDKMIDVMIRLEKATKDYIQELN
ncbi:MAG TPA: DUF4268 domain-containing protein [archaeon]|nr:DUF4268 domain-containing protein [archaeon]